MTGCIEAFAQGRPGTITSLHRSGAGGAIAIPPSRTEAAGGAVRPRGLQSAPESAVSRSGVLAGCEVFLQLVGAFLDLAPRLLEQAFVFRAHVRAAQPGGVGQVFVGRRARGPVGSCA